MAFTLALLGRSNVGKSTLFNALTQSHQALVADVRELTRDRQYGLINHPKFSTLPLMLIDTGGMSQTGSQDDSLINQVKGQTFRALDEADLILFVVDGQEGLIAQDREIASILRKSYAQKPIFILVNKCDSGNFEDALKNDFLKLGFKQTLAISAKRKSGLKTTLKIVEKSLRTHYAKRFKQFEFDNQRIEHSQITKIALVGKPNVGKSSLANCLLEDERFIVEDQAGTTRDSNSATLTHNGKGYELIDTAGIRRRVKVNEAIERLTVMKAFSAAQRSDIVLLLVNITEGLSQQDKRLIQIITEMGRVLAVVWTHWDLVDSKNEMKVLEDSYHQLPFTWLKNTPLCTHNPKSLHRLWQMLDDLQNQMLKKPTTHNINEVLKALSIKHPAPRVKNKRVKFHYAHISNNRPLTLTLHGNEALTVPASYQRYLLGGFREKLGLLNLPLRLAFKKKANPYADKPKNLTSRQVKKRKRLMKFVKK